jgi:hypothetical protein
MVLRVLHGAHNDSNFTSPISMSGHDLEGCLVIERFDDPIAVIAITSLFKSPDDWTG